jgi:N-carbamoyl-L-amino-acid hydrolase
VPNGGPLDGAYGVLAALEVARTIHDRKIALDYPLEVVVFTEEEGVRFPAFTGSRGFAGLLSPETAYRFTDENGVSFKEALAKAGYDPKRLRPVHKNPRRAIQAYVEAHIELAQLD